MVPAWKNEARTVISGARVTLIDVTVSVRFLSGETDTAEHPLTIGESIA
jgi:hypothetical protein